MNADGKQSVIYNVLPVKHYWQVHLQVCRLPIIILFFFPWDAVIQVFSSLWSKYPLQWWAREYWMGIPKIPRHNAVPDLLTTSPHLKCSTSIISHNTTVANRYYKRIFWVQ